MKVAENPRVEELLGSARWLARHGGGSLFVDENLYLELALEVEFQLGEMGLNPGESIPAFVTVRGVRIEPLVRLEKACRCC